MVNYTSTRKGTLYKHFSYLWQAFPFFVPVGKYFFSSKNNKPQTQIQESDFWLFTSHTYIKLGRHNDINVLSSNEKHRLVILENQQLALKFWFMKID